MNNYCLSHLADHTLLRDLASLLALERGATATVLAHLAEIDARRLYLPAAHPSMYSYCLGELHLSEDSACKRIRAARAARRFTVIFDAVAAGRLHVSGVVLMAPHLTEENADELLAAAAHKSKAEIEQLLAQRFPRPEELALVEAVPMSPRALALVERAGPEPVEPDDLQPDDTSREQVAPGPVGLSAPGRMDARELRPKATPMAPQRFALHLTMSQELHDKLRHAQELLSHQIPSGDIAGVLERALDALIPQLEKRKFAKTTRPRSPRPSARSRHIPAHVKRAVWERDGGRCTFVSEAGRRCPARALLEFDHVDPVARGGRATVDGMRLRCRAHNQYEAERTFGVEFMRDKREGAHGAAATREAAAQARAFAREKAEEVIPWLRALGFRADEARRAAALCEAIPETSLEQRVRRAIGSLAPSSPRRVASAWAGQAP